MSERTALLPLRPIPAFGLVRRGLDFDTDDDSIMDDRDAASVALDAIEAVVSAAQRFAASTEVVLPSAASKDDFESLCAALIKLWGAK